MGANGAEKGWTGIVKSCVCHGKEFMLWTAQKKVCNRDRNNERIFTELAASEQSTIHEGLSVETAQEDRQNQLIKERAVKGASLIFQGT